VYERHRLQVSVLLRGAEGFGARHRLHTQRLLTLSEDLPIVGVAVDARERIESVVDEVRAVSPHGLVTLERARMLAGTGSVRELAQRLARPLMTFERVSVCKRDGVLIAPPPSAPADGMRQKLMVYAGERLYDPLVRGLRTADAAGATALRGIWGYHGDHAPHGE